MILCDPAFRQLSTHKSWSDRNGEAWGTAVPYTQRCLQEQKKGKTVHKTKTVFSTWQARRAFSKLFLFSYFAVFVFCVSRWEQKTMLPLGIIYSSQLRSNDHKQNHLKNNIEMFFILKTNDSLLCIWQLEMGPLSLMTFLLCSVLIFICYCAFVHSTSNTWHSHSVLLTQ